jgi:hypothetical protein
MAEPDYWPTYATGPRESIFALGVISINYSRLEIAFARIFGIVLGIDWALSTLAMARIKSIETILAIMREALSKLDWPDDVKEQVGEFITAFKIFADNRNLLMHSTLLAGGTEANLLYKTNNAGKTTVARPTLQELRHLADEMYCYFNYSQHLANSIEARRVDWTASPVLQIPWPNTPSLPQLLQYRPHD